MQEDDDGMQLTQLTSNQNKTFFQDIGLTFDLNDNNNENFVSSVNDNDSNHDNNKKLFSLVKEANLPSPNVNLAPCLSTAVQTMKLPMPVFTDCSNITVNFMLPKQHHLV